MLSAKKIKYYSSLKLKKYRKAEGKFIAEGKRLTEELLKSNYKIETVLCTSDFQKQNIEFLKNFKNIPCEIISAKALRKISTVENPQGIVAVANIPKKISNLPEGNLIVALDNISEPGNLGTILRTSEWFGVRTALVGEDCADVYNPKTLRASMGALFHLNLAVLPLAKELKKLKGEGWKIFATDMNGKNIYTLENIPSETVVVFSNEANGLSEQIRKIADEIITIPKYGKVESLNVGAAAAVIISEIGKAFRR